MKDAGAALGIAIALWVLVGLLRAVRDLVAERAAGWMLPASQSLTFRAAQLIALVARAIAPKRRAEFEWFPETEPFRPWHLFFWTNWTWHPWLDPDAALAELEVDLRAERRVLNPVRLVLPLLQTAVELRLRNLWKIAIGIVYVPLIFGLLLFLFPVGMLKAFDESDWGHRVRKRLRSVQRRVAGRRRHRPDDNS